MPELTEDKLRLILHEVLDEKIEPKRILAQRHEFMLVGADGKNGMRGNIVEIDKHIENTDSNVAELEKKHLIQRTQIRLIGTICSFLGSTGIILWILEHFLFTHK
jgi:hypothetical protein